ncbi:alpha/beta hydrolase [Antrihabitans spumae]|uniref:Alpha/beta hydrolase n=1 Tax=Antrihabitans spumae TaxID=3373370 RepID=A0ABW7K765_9NOCA
MELDDIRAWDLYALEQLEDSLSRRIETVADVQLQLADIGRLPAWLSEAGEVARRRFQVTADDLTDEAAALSAVGECARQTREAVAHLKTELADIEADAAADGMQVDDSGAVKVVDTAERSPEEAEAREQRRVELEARAKALILQAEDVSADAAQVLNKAAEGKIDDHGATTIDAAAAAGVSQGSLSAPAPPADAATNPAAANGYWQAMPDWQRAEVIAKHPEWVGNLDGVPSQARHDANIARIGTERERLEHERDELQRKLDENVFGGTFTNDDAALWYTEQKLKDLDKLEELAKSNSDFSIMYMDMTGELGKAAFAIGDPDTADHISVTTPGLNTTVNGSFESMSQEARGLRDLSMRELNRSPDHNGENVATIGWLGFEAPNAVGPGNFDSGRGWHDVASELKASEAAPRLAQFLEGLEVASHEVDGADKNPHITAVGHSYGSLVTGLALGEPGEAADDMVVYGSPGISADKTEQLGIEHGHGYTMLGDADDLIDVPALVERFGPDPHTNPNFTHLSTDPGTTSDGILREGAHTHADYPRTGSDGETLRISGYNIAAVVAGLPELAVRE